ncbi:MAG: hypothetical protein CFK52_02290 [Chloracidobacterium sp. CP2_5A]|nr:MAG: hypothetical protein CFK52_02290 [Chloracidobacterium sp. CP2_5A]
MKKARPGKVYFVRNPPPDVLHRLPSDDLFCEALEADGWQTFRVADQNDPRLRAITSDRAVAIREAKRQAVVFLVDTERAGPGMDGIYSAGAELREDELFEKACERALKAIDDQFHPSLKRVLNFAKKRASYQSSWFRFDFLARLVGSPEQWPEYLWLLGLWPCAATRLAKVKRRADEDQLLAASAALADALLGVSGPRLPLEARLAQAGVRAAPETLTALETFLDECGRRPTEENLRSLGKRPDLWLGTLDLAPLSDQLETIELVSWRAARGGPGAPPLKWSGLRLDPADQSLMWAVDPEADDAPPLTVKWRPMPAPREPGSLQYRVAIVSDLGETLAEREVTHGGKAEEKAAFTADDLSLEASAWLLAKIVVQAKDKRGESEPFWIRPGRVESVEESRSSVRRLRALSEGLIELADAAAVAGTLDNVALDETAGQTTLAIHRGRRFRVSVPALFREVARLWRDHHAEELGRWRLPTLASGRWASKVEFIRFSPNINAPMKLWHRACRASGALAAYAGRVGLSGLCYVAGGPSAQVIGDYLDAWGDLLGAVAAQRESASAPLPLAGTIEVCAQDGRVIGLIVPPTHPLRLAWLAAYDALLFHARWTEGASAEAVRSEFRVLDGAWFPAWLPGVGDAPAFVFADALGFHAVAMTRADAAEPKADTLRLARALENQERLEDETLPSFFGRRAFERLGAEIKAYADGHPYQRRLRVHAVRAGDGLALARALGWARAADEAAAAKAAAARPDKAPLSFTLELYAPAGEPTPDGGFLDQMTARRRARGRAAVLAEDRWMMEAQPGTGSRPQPNFQWAQRPAALPETPAHLGVAFDAFAVAVTAATRPPLKGDAWPLYGLLSGLIRTYRPSPTPVWEAFLPNAEKVATHPAEDLHTQRLQRLQQSLEGWLAMARPGLSSALRATLTPEGRAELERLHTLCDWVVTLDRFAGVEYFDHPKAHPDVYETYVIDCLPERDDLGDARIVVSTALAAEVAELLGSLLKRAGLPEGAAAAQFLLERLKALSRRLPIRLAGAHPPAQELLALAYAADYCATAAAADPCWVSLRSGFLAPLDDIRDLLPASVRLKAERPERRADFLYVSLGSDGRLQIRIIEVKCRRNLASFSDEGLDALLSEVRAQVEETRQRFRACYLDDKLPKSFRALRQARLLRVLKFYADKAARHHLDAAAYDALCQALDWALGAAGEDVFDLPEGADRGWIFCPTVASAHPVELSRVKGSPGWPVPTFRFGPVPLKAAAAVAEPGRKPAPPPPGRANADIRLGYASDGRPVNWRLTIRGNPHLLVAGLPGMGKTTCLVNIARQMQAQGVCPIVFSYAPDFDEKLAAGADGADFIDVGRLDFNPLEVVDRETPRAYVHVAGVIKDIFAAIYPDLGDIQLSALRKAIVESFEAAGWSESATGETPPFGGFVEILRRTPRPDVSLRSLLARLDELWDYGFFEALSAEKPQSLWTRRRPVIVPLHRQPVAALQTGLATLALYKLYKDMFQRGLAAGITHALIFDEAHRARRLALIPTMAKECRKYGVSLVLASQEARDFDPGLFSAIGQQLVLRVNEPDARALTQNAASSGRQRALADELKSLPKFEAVYFGEEGKATRCRLLDAAGTPQSD